MHSRLSKTKGRTRLLALAAVPLASLGLAGPAQAVQVPVVGLDTDRAVAQAVSTAKPVTAPVDKVAGQTAGTATSTVNRTSRDVGAAARTAADPIRPPSQPRQSAAATSRPRSPSAGRPAAAPRGSADSTPNATGGARAERTERVGSSEVAPQALGPADRHTATVAVSAGDRGAPSPASDGQPTPLVELLGDAASSAGSSSLFSIALAMLLGALALTAPPLLRALVAPARRWGPTPLLSGLERPG